MQSRLLPATAVVALFAAASHAQVPTTTIAVSGEPAPGAPGRTFFGFYDVAIHDSGDVMFGAYLDQSDFTNDMGIWTGMPGNIQLAVREGDVAPGTGGLLFEAFTSAPHLHRTHSLGHPQMNAAGEIAIQGYLQGVDSSIGIGIWSGAPGNLSLVARAGDPAPGTPGRTFRSFNLPFIDDAGNVLFGATLDDE